MRLRGHPLHVMIIHFPVALWPAHAALHLFASRLPAGVPAVAGFWVLAAGTALGWLAALFGLSDLIELSRADDPPRLSAGLAHAAINGSVLAGFTGLLVAEIPHYPAISHGHAFLAFEVVLLLALAVGNFFGGEVVWRRPAASPKT